jgi:hypothetical protein
MKLTIAKAHKDFFQKEGWIEFDDLLSDAQLLQLNQTLDEALKVRFDLPLEKIKKLSSQEIFVKGRDLFRSNEKLRKIVTQPRLAEVVSELIETKPLRLGYDQLIPAFAPSLFQKVAHQSYENFIEKATNLIEVSCVKEVLAGVLICLGPDTQEDLSLFGKGHVVVFHPETPLNLMRLKSHPGQRYLLIVYTEKQAHYILEPRDPQTHDLKNLGYIFNDKLKDQTHPVVYR